MRRFQVVPAAYVLLVRGAGEEREVLLQLRGADTDYRPGHWASGAAGHVEYGESVVRAAVREAREELGIGLAEGDLEPLCTLQRTLPGCSDPIEQRVDFFLTTRVWEGVPAVQEPGKAHELRWCRPDALPEPMVPHEEHLLRLFAAGPVPAFLSLGFDG